MGTLDDLLIKAKELANVAGNKAQEMAELTRLRLQAAQMRSDLDANYLKLGEIVYELEKANTQNQELIDMCIAEIENQNASLDELQVKINDLKNEVRCPECMASNSKDALFCSRCGASLHPMQDCPTEAQEETPKQEPEQAPPKDL